MSLHPTQTNKLIVKRVRALENSMVIIPGENGEKDRTFKVRVFSKVLHQKQKIKKNRN